MSTPDAEILDGDYELSEAHAMADSLVNLMAQLNTEKDKRTHSQFVNTKMLSQRNNEQELNAMYRTNWVCGKGVDILPDDMTREWRTFEGKIEPSDVEDLENEEKRLQLRAKFNEAHKWARLYGTSYIIMSINDGGLPEDPVDLDMVGPGDLRHINVVDRFRMDTSQVIPIQDPMDAHFGMPEFYRIQETAIRIHHSRVLRFDGMKLPFNEFRRNNYNSASVLERLYDVVINYMSATDSAASLVYESNVDVVKVKGLMSLVSDKTTREMLLQRFQLAMMMKSINNGILLDSEEEYENRQKSFAGLPDLINIFGQITSAAWDIPGTRMLGHSASGLNATGEGDLKNYYDRVKSDQENFYAPKLDYFDDIMLRSLGKESLLGGTYSYEWVPLFQETEKEKADTELVRAQRDQIYIDAGVVPEATVAKELAANGTYNNIDEKWIEGLEEEAEGYFEEDEDQEGEINGDVVETGASESTGAAEQEQEEEEQETT